MTRNELKQAAKDQLRGNWGWAILLSLIAWIIIYIVNDIQSFVETGNDTIYRAVYTIKGGIFTENVVNPMPVSELISFVIGIFANLLLWGVIYTVLTFRDNGQKESIFSGIFSAYTNGRFASGFLTSLVQTIFTFLWTCLFVIPGIIKGYSYAMTPYIMKDMYDAGHKPTATEAITKSRHLMDGHKTDLFVLDLSFIGWWLLSIITCGIGFIWLTPYYRQTKANFYRKLAGDQFKNQI